MEEKEMTKNDYLENYGKIYDDLKELRDFIKKMHHQPNTIEVVIDSINEFSTLIQVEEDIKKRVYSKTRAIMYDAIEEVMKIIRSNIVLP